MKNNKLDIIYGVHPIMELLRAKKRKIYHIFLEKSKSKHLSMILEKIPKYTEIIYCDKKKLNLICNSLDHQSIAAYVSPFIFEKKIFSPNKFPIILFCDGIQDTKNLGALLRSAYCTNILGVVITEDASVGITASTFKSSAGFAEHIFIYKAKNMKIALQEAKKEGYEILLAAANGTSIENTQLQKPCGIVIGNEHSGIHSSLLSFGKVISLKQKENQISYNASVAGGILLYIISNRLNLI